MEYRINLAPELDDYGQLSLKNGRYASVEEAIHDALQRVASSDVLDERLRESLRQADDGDTFEIDEVFDDLNRELAAMEKQRTA